MYACAATDEIEHETPTFPEWNHSEMELEDELIGKVIHVYWRYEKQWFKGQVLAYNHDTKEHTIKYEDDQEDCLDLLALDRDRPA